MLRLELTRLVQASVDRLVAEGRLPAGLPAVELQDTKDPAHGDFATNFAMVASKPAGMNPRALAEMVKEALDPLSSQGGGSDSPESEVRVGPQPGANEPNEGHPSPPSPLSPGMGEGEPLAAVDIAGPGFINLRLNPEYVASFVPAILDLDPAQFAARASESTVEKHRINVEFVSVNPNGPITVGSGRGAAFGSTLANVLEAAGHTVHREYYINDGVNSEQMRQFARSLQRYVSERWVQWLNSPFDSEHHAVIGFVDRVVRDLGVGYGGQDLAFFEQELRRYASDHREDQAGRMAVAWMDDWARDTLTAAIKGRYMASYLTGQYRAYEDIVAGYPADYVIEAAEAIMRKEPRDGVLNCFGDSGTDWYKDRGQQAMLARQQSDLFLFGTTFDTWFSEQSLHDAGVVQAEIQELVAKGAADDRPIRHKLKLAKGGVIEDVEIEEQGSETDDLTIDDSVTAQEQSSVLSREVVSQNTLWLRSTKFGDDMDRVIRRKDGRLTYIASDIAYHKDKFNRPSNADKLITILGPDHHGYIGRLHAVLAAADYQEFPTTEEHWESEGGLPNPLEEPRPLTDVEAKLYATAMERDACLYALERARRELDVIIFQLVRFVKDGKPAPMRKRDGNIYALIDLIDEIGKKVKPEAPLEEQRKSGKDVARFFYLMRSHDTTFDFDLDLAEKQSDENPVFYVQYAHARICSVMRKAEEVGSLAPSAFSRDSETANASLLTHPKETALIKKVLDLPYEISRCADDYGVHRLTTYAIELARTYHHFYDACRVIQPEEPELSRARLALCEVTKTALRATLDLLGIEAPESM